MKNLSFEETQLINGGTEPTTSTSLANDIGHAIGAGAGYVVCGARVVANWVSNLF